jgi:hypothetical protein
MTTPPHHSEYDPTLLEIRMGIQRFKPLAFLISSNGQPLQLRCREIRWQNIKVVGPCRTSRCSCICSFIYFPLTDLLRGKICDPSHQIVHSSKHCGLQKSVKGEICLPPVNLSDRLTDSQKNDWVSFSSLSHHIGLGSR